MLVLSDMNLKDLDQLWEEAKYILSQDSRQDFKEQTEEHPDGSAPLTGGGNRGKAV